MPSFGYADLGKRTTGEQERAYSKCRVCPFFLFCDVWLQIRRLKRRRAQAQTTPRLAGPDNPISSSLRLCSAAIRTVESSPGVVQFICKARRSSSVCMIYLHTYLGTYRRYGLVHLGSRARSRAGTRHYSQLQAQMLSAPNPSQPSSESTLLQPYGTICAIRHTIRRMMTRSPPGRPSATSLPSASTILASAFPRAVDGASASKQEQRWPFHCAESPQGLRSACRVGSDESMPHGIDALEGTHNPI